MRKALLILMLMVPSALLPAELDDVIKQIVAVYNSAIEAMNRGDAEAALKMDTDDWVSITLNEKPRPKAELAFYIRRDIASMKNPPGWIAFWKPDYEHNGTGNGLQLYEVQLKGDEAIVLGLVGDTHAGKIGGADHQVWNGSHVRDTWVKTGEGWKRRKHEKLTVNERMIDGKTARQ
jgi:ketosteroid isomerase-like protein